MKTNQNFDTRRFINELQSELNSFSDAWKDVAKKCPNYGNEWATYATVSTVLFSLSHCIKEALKKADKKK